MAWTHYVLSRGDEEIELEIEYEIEPYDPGCISGPPEHCYPPEGGNVTSLQAFHEGEIFQLLETEDREIAEHIETNHDHADDDDDRDYDYYREAAE